MDTLVERCAISTEGAEVFSLRFSEDGHLLAAGCGDGQIKVYNTKTGHLNYTLAAAGADALPITCMRFRPASASSTRNVLLAVGADGAIRHWHATSSKLLSTLVEEGNQIFACAYSPDASLFATTGKDKCVRVYDEASRQLLHTLSGGLADVTPGHSNRVFALRFVQSDPNLIITGGWDNTVLVHDIRAGCAVRSIYGPHVCGEAVDLARPSPAIPGAPEDLLLTGSWSKDSPLSLWDYGTGRKLRDVPWLVQNPLRDGTCTGAEVSADAAPMVYAAAFSCTRGSEGTFFAAGGSGCNELKVFRTADVLSLPDIQPQGQAPARRSSLTAAAAAPAARAPGSQVQPLVGTVASLPCAVYSLDWDPSPAVGWGKGKGVRASLAVAGGAQSIRIVDVQAAEDEDGASAISSRAAVGRAPSSLIRGNPSECIDPSDDSSSGAGAGAASAAGGSGSARLGPHALRALRAVAEARSAEGGAAAGGGTASSASLGAASAATSSSVAIEGVTGARLTAAQEAELLKQYGGEEEEAGEE